MNIEKLGIAPFVMVGFLMIVGLVVASLDTGMLHPLPVSIASVVMGFCLFVITIGILLGSTGNIDMEDIISVTSGNRSDRIETEENTNE